jgi:hypothetical protein
LRSVRNGRGGHPVARFAIPNRSAELTELSSTNAGHDKPHAFRAFLRPD